MTVPSLPTRARELRKRLEELDAKSGAVKEASALAEILANLRGPAEHFRRTVRQLEILRQAGVSVEDPEIVTKVRKGAATLAERFEATRTSDELKKKKSLVHLESDLESAAQDLAARTRESWKQHRYRLFAGDTPDHVEASIAKTPENVSTLRHYRSLFEEFRRHFDKAPDSAGEVQEVHRKAEVLADTAREFDFEVPGDVKAFLDAIQRRGASIEQLTPEVLEWLEKHNALGRYRIVSVN